MSGDSPALLLAVVVLVLVAGALASAEAALSSFSKARAEEMLEDGRPGAARLRRILDDPAPYLNTALFVRLLTETAAVVLAAVLVQDVLDSSRLVTVVVTIAVMVVVSFVAIGVGPRTVGRQHSERVALIGSAALLPLTRVLGPVPRLLILLGNALTPGKGFSAGPFSSEAELRELVDLAEASSVIESDERAMIHSVFELGDTSVREVMVPRTDVVFIERHKTLRQAMSLFLRTGYSRLPVVGDDLDDIVGFAYLKDVSRRVFDRHEVQTKEHVESVMRAVLHVPDSKPVDDLLREMQAQRRHIAVVVDEYGGTAGVVTIEDLLEEIVGEIADEFDDEVADVVSLPDGSTRVSSRYPVDDLEDIFGVRIVEEDVDSVGGLMAKHLGTVPIPGSSVEVAGLRFEAESTAGRRKRIGFVLIRPVAPVSEDPAPVAAER